MQEDDELPPEIGNKQKQQPSSGQEKGGNDQKQPSNIGKSSVSVQEPHTKRSSGVLPANKHHQSPIQSSSLPSTVSSSAPMVPLERLKRPRVTGYDGKEGEYVDLICKEKTLEGEPLDLGLHDQKGGRTHGASTTTSIASSLTTSTTVTDNIRLHPTDYVNLASALRSRIPDVLTSRNPLAASATSGPGSSTTSGPKNSPQTTKLLVHKPLVPAKVAAVKKSETTHFRPISDSFAPEDDSPTDDSARSAPTDSGVQPSSAIDLHPSGNTAVIPRRSFFKSEEEVDPYESSVFSSSSNTTSSGEDTEELNALSQLISTASDLLEDVRSRPRCSPEMDSTRALGSIHAGVAAHAASRSYDDETPTNDEPPATSTTAGHQMFDSNDQVNRKGK